MQVVGIRGATSGSSVLRVSMEVGTGSSEYVHVLALLFRNLAVYCPLPALGNVVLMLMGLVRSLRQTCFIDQTLPMQVEFLKNPGLLRQVIETQAKKEAMTHWWVEARRLLFISRYTAEKHANLHLLRRCLKLFVLPNCRKETCAAAI